ncbi:alpha/beta hydrolase domain-containing protein [Pseudonocardia lacus]|uniref:alpha/beta hydrolase domain-containing protein n=1 Tax=Pseudonocardia lacus TaxID=2835865 RepID=UPI001BDC2262|nr:alpha/beta hydrolase domain-containing protein [Pseudonocardia lacus]
MIHGPVTGGDHGWAFGRPILDLAEHGYVEEEFFLSGDATTYRPVVGTELGRDGLWRVEPKGTLPFTTRLLVYRPADPERFNGTAVVCWNNVTAGYELFHGETPEIIEGGYAFVGATVQRVGVHGFPAAPQGLAAWDPGRYGSLDIPTDDCSYDIFSQVGRAVGANRDRSGIDPLGGLDVQRVIALGASQSAGRLSTYVNAIHPLGRVFDGFILQIYFGAGTPLEGGDRTVAPAAVPGPARLPRGANLLRELDVPVMVVNSELEAIACHSVRQPDTDRVVTWESAGTTHVAVQSQLLRNRKYRRDFGVAPPPEPERMNRIAITPLYDAALHHMNRWAGGGAPAPSQPLVEFAGAEPTVVRDEHGIARGGIRLPQVEAPVATNSSVPLSTDFVGALRGSNDPFTREKLDALYGDETGYLARFEAAAQRAVEAGVLLPRDVAPAVAEAAEEYRRACATDRVPT